jgi:hypothetical protein
MLSTALSGPTIRQAYASMGIIGSAADTIPNGGSLHCTASPLPLTRGVVDGIVSERGVDSGSVGGA